MKDVHGADWSPDGADLAVVSFAGGRYRLEYPIGKVLYEPPAGSPTRVCRRKAIASHFWIIRASVTSAVRWRDRSSRQEGDAVVRLEVVAGTRLVEHGDEIWFTGSRTGKAAARRSMR